MRLLKGLYSNLASVYTEKDIKGLFSWRADCEEAARGYLCASQGESPQRKLTLKTP